MAGTSGPGHRTAVVHPTQTHRSRQTPPATPPLPTPTDPRRGTPLPRPQPARHRPSGSRPARDGVVSRRPAGSGRPHPPLRQHLGRRHLTRIQGDRRLRRRLRDSPGRLRRRARPQRTGSARPQRTGSARPQRRWGFPRGGGTVGRLRAVMPNARVTQLASRPDRPDPGPPHRHAPGPGHARAGPVWGDGSRRSGGLDCSTPAIRSPGQNTRIRGPPERRVAAPHTFS